MICLKQFNTFLAWSMIKMAINTNFPKLIKT